MTEFKANRYAAYTRLHEWMDAGLIPQEGNVVDLLARLLGVDVQMMVVGHLNERQHDLIDKLNGPHGLTVYKMLLIRRDSHVEF